MKFMNEWEIEMNVERYRYHLALGPATRFLDAYMREVNSHSDGWPYWSAPVKAAAKLMTVIEKGDQATQRDVLKALTPIKAFMTRRGLKAGMALLDTRLFEGNAVEIIL